MNSQQIELYQRIQAFSFEGIDAQLTFSKRLARENGWSLPYTQRVIEEYKKFVFLAVVAHPATPSDAVDQVWHLHLTYTRSYWQEFCPKVLQKSLHHEPTLGGTSEQIKFDDWYTKTLESYKNFFDEMPPADIWPSSEIRFGRDLNFIRINTQQNWVLPKLAWNSLEKVQFNKVAFFTLLFTLSLIVTSCQAIANFPNPINFTGADFLKFYILIGIIGLVLAFWLRHSLCLPDGTPNQETENLNPYEVAFLAGNSDRLVKTAIINLIQQGYAEIETKQQFLWIKQRKLIFRRMVDSSGHPVEQAIAQEIIAADGSIKEVLQKNTGIAELVSLRLQQLGLVMNANQSSKAQFYPLLIMIFILGLGVVKMFVGISRDKPIGFLIICLCGFIVFGQILFTKPYRSRYGDRVLKNLLDRFKHLKTVHSTNFQFSIAFALFGTTVLVANPVFAELNQMFTSSDGGGGDGDGGGGCGGCGGCGG